MQQINYIGSVGLALMYNVQDEIINEFGFVIYEGKVVMVFVRCRQSENFYAVVISSDLFHCGLVSTYIS